MNTKLKCAKWCGRGCTKAEYDQAVKDGKALAAALGPGWKHKVWENMGWHYRAVSPCRRMGVHHSGYQTRMFTAYLCTAGTVGGYWTGSAATPAAAVLQAARSAREEMGRFHDVLAPGADVRRIFGIE